MMAVVVVVVVVVVVGGGGGEQLLYMGPPRAHVWVETFKEQNPLLLRFYIFFISNAHVWCECPCTEACSCER